MTDQFQDECILENAFEQGIELVNYIANARLDCLKGLDDRRPIWQRYSEGQAVIHFHCAGKATRSRLKICISYRRQNFELMDFFIHAHQSTMLVEIGEFTEQLYPLASLVRLIPLERCDAFLVDAFEEGIPPTREALWRVLNRKLDLISDAARIQFRERASEVVKRIAHAGCAFADTDLNVHRNDIERLIADARVKIIGGEIVFRIENEIFEPRQVFATPIQKGIDFIKLFEHSMSS